MTKWLIINVTAFILLGLIILSLYFSYHHAFLNKKYVSLDSQEEKVNLASNLIPWQEAAIKYRMQLVSWNLFHFNPESDENLYHGVIDSVIVAPKYFARS